MTSESQIHIPESFVALFVPAKGRKPSEPREHIAQRYELCEDMAQMLCDTAREKAFGLGVDEPQVLLRIHQGLMGSDDLRTEESLWVVRRLAELLDWPLPPELDWRPDNSQ